MSDMMTFPDTWEEYEKSYGFTDNEEVYTNGARLIPSFRVKQWLNHLPSIEPERKKGKWIGYKADDKNWQRDDGSPIFMNCSECHEAVINNGSAHWNFCPNCGADMREII